MSARLPSRRLVPLLPRSLGALGVLALLWPAPAHANAGLPMIVVALPLQVAALVPVVLLEAWILGRAQLGLSRWQVLRVTALANAFSTLLGNPLAWLALVVGQVVLAVVGAGLGEVVAAVASRQVASLLLWPVGILQAAVWVYPVYLDVHWLLPLGATLLMVPYFFVSWWCEFWAAQRLAPEVARAPLRAAIGRANAVSYVLMIVGTTAWLVVAIAEFDREKFACLERGEPQACSHLLELADTTYSDSADELLRRLCARNHAAACAATARRAVGDGDLARVRRDGERACALGNAAGCRLWAVAALREGDRPAAASAAAQACARGRSDCCGGAEHCDAWEFPRP